MICTSEPLSHIVSWGDIEDFTKSIAHQVHQCDRIVAIHRGGLIVGVILSHLLKAPLDTMCISRYDDINESSNDRYLLDKDTLRDRVVLVVDDISDEGITLKRAVEIVLNYNPRKVVTATYAIKDHTSFVPDIFHICLPCTTWAIFPWEGDSYADNT